MEKDNKLVKIIHLLLLGISLVLSFMAIFKNQADITVFGTNPITKVSYVLFVPTLLFGIFYIVMDYKKNAAFYYKCFMFFFALSSFFQVLLTSGMPMYYLVLNLISFTCIIILATAKDLGKTKTYLVALVLIVCRVMLLSTYLKYFNTFGTSTFGIVSSAINNLLIAIVTSLMIVGKYADKKARGSNI